MWASGPKHEESSPGDSAVKDNIFPPEHMALFESDGGKFLHLCRRLAPPDDADLAMRVAARAEFFYLVVGRRDVGGGV